MEEKGQFTKCSRLIFSCRKLLPSGVIRQICTSRHFLSTQTTRRSDDRVRACQLLFSVMLFVASRLSWLTTGITSYRNFISHYSFD